MIGTLRKYTQKSVLKIILWFVIFAMAAPSFFSLFSKKQKDQATNDIAKVGDQGITANEFRMRYKPIVEYIREIKKQYGTQADLLLSLSGLGNDPEKIAMDELVQEKIIQKAAAGINPEISKEYLGQKLNDSHFVNKYLSNVIPPHAFTNGELDLDFLANLLKHTGMSEADFEALVNNAIKNDLLIKLLQGAVYVSQDAINQQFIKEYAKRKFSLFTVSIDDYIKKANEQKMSQEDLKKFFDGHKENYRVPEKRSARLWEFAAQSYGINISDKEIENYYKKNKNDFVEQPEEIQIRRILIKAEKPEEIEQKRKRAQEIAAELTKNPAKFEEVAKKESNASEKGAIITVKRGEKEALFDKSAFALAKTDEISPVIKTQDGFEILQRVNKKAATYKKLDAVKDEIKKKLTQTKFDASFSPDAQRVLTQAKDLPDIFNNFITQRKAKETSLSAVEKKPGLRKSKLFDLEKNGQKAFYQEGGKGYIAELTSIDKSFIPEFDGVKDKVSKDAYYQKAHDALVADLNLIRKRLKTESAEKAIKGIKAEVEHTDWIDPQNEKDLNKLEKKHITRDKFSDLTKPKQAIEFTDRDKGYVVELTDIEGVDEQKLKANQKKIEMTLYQDELQQLSQSFMNHLKANTKVEINDAMLAKVKASKS